MFLRFQNFIWIFTNFHNDRKIFGRVWVLRVTLPSELVPTLYVPDREAVRTELVTEVGIIETGLTSWLIGIHSFARLRIFSGGYPGSNFGKELLKSKPLQSRLVWQRGSAMCKVTYIILSDPTTEYFGPNMTPPASHVTQSFMTSCSNYLYRPKNM